VRDDNSMPINQKAKLVENILDLKSLEQKPIREGFGLGLVEAADADPNVGGILCKLRVAYMHARYHSKRI